MGKAFSVCYVCCALSTVATRNVNNEMDSAGQPRQPALLRVFTANCDNAHCLDGIGELS
jgi:hypothetical protein